MPEASQTLLPALDKLEKHVALSAADRQAFLALPFTHRTVTAGTYLAREKDAARACGILLSGFAYRHNTLPDGSRQIVSVHVPGDLLDVQNMVFPVAAHNVQMMTPGAFAAIPAAELASIAAQRPALQRALWLSTLIDSSIFSEWITNVGRRDARSRVSHLLCEFVVRLKAIGLCNDRTFDLPMTQEQIGDATGLTSVHVNRTMQGLTRSGLISRHRRFITIEDWSALCNVGGFDAAYLHQDPVAA